MGPAGFLVSGTIAIILMVLVLFALWLAGMHTVNHQGKFRIVKYILQLNYATNVGKNFNIKRWKVNQVQNLHELLRRPEDIIQNFAMVFWQTGWAKPSHWKWLFGLQPRNIRKWSRETSCLFSEISQLWWQHNVWLSIVIGILYELKITFRWAVLWFLNCHFHIKVDSHRI